MFGLIESFFESDFKSRVTFDYLTKILLHIRTINFYDNIFMLEILLEGQGTFLGEGMEG